MISYANEKYGAIDRFKTLVKTLPFKYKKIIPEEKYLIDKKIIASEY